MKGTIKHKDMNSYLFYLPFTFEQIKEIIKKLIESRQFTAHAQKNLLWNSSLYRVDTLPYIQDSIIEPTDIWAPSAVCLFLEEMSYKLSNEYLEKIAEKYGKYPSILIALGYFQHYRRDDYNYYKIGYEFKYNWNVVEIAKTIFSSVSVALISSTLILYFMYFFGRIGSDYFLLTLVMIGILFIMNLKIWAYLRNNYFKYSIKKHLKKYDFIKDDYIVEEIIKDLYSAFYT